MKETFRTLALAAALALAACGARQDGAGATQDRAGEPAPAVAEERARSIATALAADNGYDLDAYPVTAVRWLEDEGAWWVVFEHVPPARPGEHFAVQVDGQSGQARLVPGR